jgi:hypothetical protein
MRISSVAFAVAAVVALPRLADARPIMAGVGVGRIQSKLDANGDASDSLQVFGRLNITPRVAAQVELQKIATPQDQVDIRTGTLLVVVDLGHSGHLYPTMFGGLGLDRATDTWGDTITGSHKEGGFGLEYRADGGLTIGVDVRLGGRSVDPQKYMIEPAYNDSGTIALYQPETLQSGEYRSGRVFAAIRF